MEWSLAMIARNNEDVIGSTLECVKSFIDEIIVVDTGSTDNTISVAKEHGATVYEFDWIDDFSAARNYSFSKATGDWIMWLDTGDIITEKARKAFVELKNGATICDPTSDAEIIVSTMNRGIDENGIVQHSFLTVRLLKRLANPIWNGAVHEVPSTDNEKAYLAEECVVNDPVAWTNKATDRNLNILNRLYDAGDRSPRTMYYRGIELYCLGRWKEAIVAIDEYLAVTDFTWHYYDALLQQAKCYNGLGDVNGSAQSLLQAIYYDPNRAEAFVALAEMLYNKGEWLRALPFYKAVVGMSVPKDGSFTILPCYGYFPLERIGMCYLQTERTKECLDFLRQAIKLAPEPEAIRIKGILKEIKDKGY